jgi:hypothetical protein
MDQKMEMNAAALADDSTVLCYPFSWLWGSSFVFRHDETNLGTPPMVSDLNCLQCLGSDVRVEPRVYLWCSVMTLHSYRFERNTCNSS